MLDNKNETLHTPCPHSKTWLGILLRTLVSGHWGDNGHIENSEITKLLSPNN